MDTANAVAKLAARFKRTKERSPSSVEAPNTGIRSSNRTDGKVVSPSLISAPLSVMVSTTFGVANQNFLPRCQASVRGRTSTSYNDTVLDFDISYFYAGRPPRISHGGDIAGEGGIRELRPLPDSSARDDILLVPLVAARWRDSIRRRQEGFEMKEGQLKTFCTASTSRCKLISLHDAMSRDDVRRRAEGYEAAMTWPPSWADRTAITEFAESTDRETVSSSGVDGVRLSTANLSTLPSLYSSESWVESLRVISEANTTTVHFVSDTYLTIAAEAASTTSEFANRNDGIDRASDSIDEASFLRMAAPLGW